MNHWLTTILICLPVAGALVIAVAAALARSTGSFAALVSLVEVGFWITARVALRLRLAHAPVRAAALVVPRSRRQLPRRPVRVLALARRRDDRRDGGVRDLRLVGRPRTDARVLRADAPPDRRDRRRLHRAGPAALLRVLRGDADPALRADRRLGRPRPPARDADVRHLHRRRLAADARGDRRRSACSRGRST